MEQQEITVCAAITISGPLVYHLIQWNVKKAGRPKGPPSTIVNLRIPLALLAQLDRYIDQLEVQTGLKANRGMIARRALELFLETRATGKRKRSL